MTDLTLQELADLDFAVAHAEGVVDELEAADREGCAFVRRSPKTRPGAAVIYETWAPTRDRAHAMRLMEKYRLDVVCNSVGSVWGVMSYDLDTNETSTYSGPTPMVAICRAVAAIKAAKVPA